MKIIALMILSIPIWSTALAVSPRTGEIKMDGRLQILSAYSINAGGNFPEDSIINLCLIEQRRAIKRKDNASLFKARQIEVNSYCIKGDFGLATNKAYEMHEDARSLNNEFAIGLALQAIGGTYIHAERFDIADMTLEKAAEKIDIYGTDESYIQLLIQRIYVCMQLSDTERMNRYILEASRITELSSLPHKNIYLKHLLFYKTASAIRSGDRPAAEQLLGQMTAMKFPNSFFIKDEFSIMSSYYLMTGEIDKALIYCDSVLYVQAAASGGNEYRNAMINKAVVLENIGNSKGACEMYKEISKLSDSLNSEQYIRQIDSLHTIYHTDELQIVNAVARNGMMTKIIVYTLVILCLTIIVVVMVKRRNVQVTASKRRLEIARETALESIKSKSMFLSNMSHELRTPLNAIVGFSSMLTTNYESDDNKRKQYSIYINQNADLLMKLINDIVNLSELNDSDIKFSYSDCDVVTLCHNVMETIESVKQTKASLIFTSDVDRLVLFTDGERLQQVLINLLINATKFTKEGTIKLHLGINDKDNEILFSVEDTGCGIPLERQARIFDRFKKLHENKQGVGLGLSICKLIVDHIGGKIWIDSAYTSGTRFVFTHPLNKQQP